NVTLDWWNVEIEGALSTLSVATILDECYAQGNQTACSLFTRDPLNNQIVSMILAPANLAVINVEGYDLGVDYRFPETSFGQFTAALNASYTSKYDVQQTETAEPENVVGMYFDRDPNWRLRANS